MKNALKLALYGTATALALLSPTAHAQPPSVEANVSLVSDYRFRGVSLSDESIALQGGVDLGWESGFYTGFWGSTIEPVGSSELELDLYGGYGGETLAGLGYDIGVLVYTYPDQDDALYAELYGGVSKSFGALDHEAGVAWAPEQDNIGGDDNLYVFYAGAAAVGATPLSLTWGLGFETGAFGDPDGDGDDKWDWTLGVTYSSPLGLDFGLAYVDTSEDGKGAEEQLVLSLGRTF